MEYDLRIKLDAMPKRQLQGIAKDVGVAGFSALNKADLVAKLLEAPGIQSAVNPTWWKRFHNHFYGAITIVGAVIGLVTWAPWQQPKANSTDPPPSVGAETDRAGIERIRKTTDVAATYSETFDGTSPYPTKYQKIIIGSDAAIVRDIYPEAKITDGGNAFAVWPKDGVFTHVVFGFHQSRDTEHKKISGLFFHVKEEFRDEFRAEVVEKLQQYDYSRDSLTGAIQWPDVEGATVDLRTNAVYWIHAAD